MKTKLFLFVFAIVESIGNLSAEGGSCGRYVTWNLTAGVLTISGEGDMSNYHIAYNENYTKRYTTAPWNSSVSAIKTIVINSGVTHIGDCAFSGCISLTSVTIPNRVKSIGYDAFENCSSLTSVIIPNSVQVSAVMLSLVAAV